MLSLAFKRAKGDRSIRSHAGVAQSVEQLIRNQQVSGSSPLTSSKVPIHLGIFYFFEILNQKLFVPKERMKRKNLKRRGSFLQSV